MTICQHCGDTRVSYACKVVGEGAGRYAYWPECPHCADIPRLEHMARVYAYRRVLSKVDADGWLGWHFRPDQQATIRQLAGVGLQLSLL